MLEKRRDLRDKRRVIVSATLAGARLIQEAPKTMHELLARRFESLETWEQSFVVAALQRVALLMDAAPLLRTGAIERVGESVTRAQN